MSVFLRSLLPAVLAWSSLHAQEPAPAPVPPKAAEGKKPEPAAQEVSGSASGTAKDAPTNLKIRPGKAAQAEMMQNYPMKYLLVVAEAMKSFQARDFQGAIRYADQADALLPPSVWTLNVRGAVAIEQLKFEEGLKFCVEALRLDPEFFPAKFNLCEIPFLKGDYAEARRRWIVLHNVIPKDDPTIELLTYRIFLTYLLEKDMVHARDWLEKLPFPSQTPAYQYAHAAWERQNGRLEKWDEWLRSAEFIWPEVKRANFVDVLLQLKWIKSDEFTVK